MPRVVANYQNLAVTPDDFALGAPHLDGCRHLHDLSPRNPDSAAQL